MSAMHRACKLFIGRNKKEGRKWNTLQGGKQLTFNFNQYFSLSREPVLWGTKLCIILETVTAAAVFVCVCMLFFGWASEQ